MLQYLEEQYGERATKGDKHNLEFMRNEAKRLEAQFEEVTQKEKQNAGQDDHKSARNSESDTDEDVSKSTCQLIVQNVLEIGVNI